VNRRNFLLAAALSPALPAQEGLPRPDEVEQMTAGSAPAIAISQVGFRPEGRKLVVVRHQKARSLTMTEIGSGPRFEIKRPLKNVPSELGPAMIGDFTEVTRLGLYQIRVNEELSPPFFIRPDAWRRFLPTVVSYHRAQRCGVAVPNVHPVCHLDDARRRDNGIHLDLTGGWHDAGDVRKWMDATMMNAFGLLAIARHLGADWDLAGSGLSPLEEELRWGNVYFLKMQDTDGRVFADVAGGVDGDNSDNHWTDNAIGTPDDRFLNPTKPLHVQAMFTAIEAIYAQQFRAESTYAARCLDAAKRCWTANPHDGTTAELAWWTLAAIELYRATRDESTSRAAADLASKLTAMQHTGAVGGQSKIRGFWPASPGNPESYRDAAHGALPAFAVLEAARALPHAPGASKWRDAVRLYIQEYVVPMCERSAYGVMPYAIYNSAPTPERYRPLAGNLTYRFFMPVRKGSWWQGLNAHLSSHALLLAVAAREFSQAAWRDLAYRQLEWTFGANPFGATLTSGIGVRNPYPHSRYVGIIPGGIMNGIAGNTNDEPVLDTTYAGIWRTNEYWSPHVGYFEWAQAVLESEKSI
jgi:Glycosyl hydrolase family 9